MSTDTRTDKPYAYRRWVCSECDGEPIERRTDTYDLVCETCGLTFEITRMDRAEYVPDPDEDEEDTGGEQRG